MNAKIALLVRLDQVTKLQSLAHAHEPTPY